MFFKVTLLSIILSFNLSAKNIATSTSLATFAGGCFWCMEPPFEKLPGVKKVISGFSGGEVKDPSYYRVAHGQTKHLETVQVSYDPKIISYSELLKVFWKNIDPTDDGGQFVDRGRHYTTAIFYHNKEQRRLADLSKKYIERQKFFSKKIVTPILAYKNFYRAEEYHQDFYKKNPKSIKRYKSYRAGSGRDQFINKYWRGKKLNFHKPATSKPTPKKSSWKNFKKPSKAQLKKSLSQLQYEVTQEDGTERPFKNKYWDNKEEGIYVDIVSGEPLFSSTDKYKSGTGWPSFTKPILKELIVEKEDRKLFATRTEVRSKIADGHLGHVFNDGPKPTGLRYCINSAALKFIKKEDLKKYGYGEFLKLFD